MSSLSAAVVVIDAGNVLLIQRDDFQVWALPGGRIEQGETAAQAAIREVQEETGLTVALTCLVGLYARPQWAGSAHSAVFAAYRVSGDLHPQAGEAIDARFFAPAALPKRLSWWHRQPITDALNGVGGSAIWHQHLTWPIQDEIPYQKVLALRDQGPLPPQLIRKAWDIFCHEIRPGDQVREIES
jgi:ADP-ribose pyrophosphatase YjhB (NUDIX family)